MELDQADTVPTVSRGRRAEGTVVAERYRLHAVLGEGGMGTVYRAEDLHLDEWVALKTLHLEAARINGVLDRFKREVKLARRVTHENVARVYELGRDGELHFLTMELIDGEPLSKTMRRGLDPNAVGPIVRGIAAALDAAHAASVIHRDIKPDNVMISSRGRVVVTDFGIARSFAAMTDTSSGLIGTPAYMSPEQINGDEITSKSDLYSLGVLIYELLTGRLPWVGPNPMSVAISRLRQPPPDPREFAPGLDPEIALMVLRCLERAPDQRPDSAAEVASLFGAGGSTDIGSLAPTSRVLPARTRVAVLPFAGEELLAGLLTQDLIDSLSQVQSLRVLARRMTEGATARSLTELARSLGVDRIVEGSVHPVESSYRVVVRLIDGATGEQLHAERMEVSRVGLTTIGDRVTVRLAEAMHLSAPTVGPHQELAPSALELYLEGRQHCRGFNTSRAVELLTKADALMPQHPLVISALVVARVRSLYLSRTHDPREIVWAQQTAANAVRLAPDLSEPRHALALARLHAGDLIGTVMSLREAIARSPSNAEALGILGELLCEAGRVQEGTRRLELAVSLDDSLITPRWVIARHRAYQGDFAGAIASMEEVMARTKETRLSTPCARLALWQRDLEALERFGQLIESQKGDRSILTLYPMKAVFGKEPLEAAIARCDHLAEQPGASWQQIVNVHQVMAEIAGFLGRTDVLLSQTRRAVHLGMFDQSWADGCPILEEARRMPEWQALRAQMAAHAEAIIDAVWSSGIRPRVVR